jgi:very-short-patch-repair endonuclease
VIKRQARNGALHRIHRGVYIVGHLALPGTAMEFAALLACGEGALISHRSAAYLWSMLEEQPQDVDVTLVGRRCRPKEGVRVHGVARLDRRDVRRKGEITLTAPARTLIDLASDASDQELERAVSEARVLRLLREEELERALERAGQRTGGGRMRAFLRDEAGPSFTRSDGERRLRKLIRVARLPAPIVNARAAGFEVDFLWPDQRVVVEVQGYRYHQHRGAFERDHRRAMALENAGYHVIRITWRQLVEDPLAVVAQIARALERRS